MKRKDFLVFVGALILSASLFAEVNKEKQIRDLVFENVEALSADEPRGVYLGDDVYYEWNNTHWEGRKDGSSGNKFPKFDSCRDAGLDGHQVHCTQGSGNCWNGTSCISD